MFLPDEGEGLLLGVLYQEDQKPTDYSVGFLFGGFDAAGCAAQKITKVVKTTYI